MKNNMELIFDENYYFGLYPDVHEAVKKNIFKSGHDHFLKHGKHEKREHKFIENKPKPKDIYEWINELLKDIPNPIIFEIGASTGVDTKKLASIKNSTIYAFEPDPRCNPVNLENVKWFKNAISNKKGKIEFYQSDTKNNINIYSNSLLKPKNHLSKHSHVKFDNTIKVPTITLDTFCKENNIKHIDFLWMDTQGAEYNIFEGAEKILKKTKYIYTEYSDFEMYENQKNLDDIMKLIETYFILDIWDIEPSNVLLQNINLL